MESNSPKKVSQKELTVIISGKSEASTRHPDVNEDAIGFDEKAGFAMVLDGIGGEVGGREASSLARDLISDNLYGKATKIEETRQHLETLIREASRTVKNDPEAGKTTAVVAKIVEAEKGPVAIIGSVGDSRIYLFREGKLEQTTEDDSPLPVDFLAKIDRVVSRTELRSPELPYFQMRNMVTQALGDESLDIHLYQVDLKDGDKLILTSDGIHDNLTFDEMEKIIALEEAIADMLVESAKNRSQESHFRAKKDDMSAVVIKVNKFN